jgi:hypothetical protein
MSRNAWLAAALVLIVGVVVVGVTRHRRAVAPPSPSAFPGTSASASAAAAPAPSFAPWPENALTYDCSPFAPKAVPAPSGTPDGAVGTLLRESRWRSVTAASCGAGLQLDGAKLATLDRAIAQVMSKPAVAWSPLTRAAAQNAALGVARCARAPENAHDAPAPPRIAALKRAARALVQRLALDDAALSSIEAPSPSPLAAWTSGTPGAGDTNIPTRVQGTDLHARSAGYAVTTRALPPVNGADAFYGNLVVIDRAGKARVLDVPSTLVLRKTNESGLTLCFADLADPELYPTPTLLPAPAPATPAAYGNIGCQRCHSRGRRLSEASPPTAAPPDARALDDVTAWYAAKGI